jgi:hypothetical protein
LRARIINRLCIGSNYLSVIQLPVILQSSDDPEAGNNYPAGEPSNINTAAAQSPAQISPNRPCGRNELEVICEQSPDTPDGQVTKGREQSSDAPDGRTDPLLQLDEQRKSDTNLPDAGGSSEESPEGALPDTGCSSKQIELSRRSSSSRAGKKLHLPLNVSSSVAGSGSGASEAASSYSVEKLPLKATKSDVGDSSAEQGTSFELQTPFVTVGTSFSVAHDTVDGRLQVPMTAPVLTSQKSDNMPLLFKMNRKIRSCLRFTSRSGPEANSEVHDENRSAERLKAREIRLLDLTSDDVTAAPSMQKLTYAELTQIGTSKSICLIKGGPKICASNLMKFAALTFFCISGNLFLALQCI